MEQVNLNKKVYSKTQYEKVINTKFSQLTRANDITPAAAFKAASEINPQFEIDNFFNDYAKLFNLIPKAGVSNSHEYLIKTSSEYVNFVVNSNETQGLIDEINQLQRQNLELNQKIINLTLSGSK